MLLTSKSSAFQPPIPLLLKALELRLNCPRIEAQLHFNRGSIDHQSRLDSRGETGAFERGVNGMCWSANVREKAEEGWILVLRMKKVGGESYGDVAGKGGMQSRRLIRRNDISLLWRVCCYVYLKIF